MIIIENCCIKLFPPLITPIKKFVRSKLKFSKVQDVDRIEELCQFVLKKNYYTTVQISSPSNIIILILNDVCLLLVESTLVDSKLGRRA